MTREEAIKQIEAFRTCMIVDDAEPYVVEALNMAVEALEREPCEDVIRRQAVRHILNHEVKMPIKVWKKVFELVDNLPPVTPQPIECEERKNGNCPFYAN